MPEHQTNPAQIGRWLIGEFVSGLTQALEGMSGEPPTLTVDPESGPLPDGQLTWKQPLSIGNSVWVATEESAWIEIGDLTLRAAGLEDTDAATAKSTFIEILGQALSVLARGLAKRLQTEVNCEAGEETGEPPSLTWTRLTVVIGSAPAKTLNVAFDDALTAALIEADTREHESPPPPPPEAPPARNTSVALQPAITASKTLELLLDVELPVSVSFGRAQLPLKDVIKLTTGSIVELNRTILEPVEVIVNNCVIAKGEVVVVEGNFGVRIQQVISRQERLRTLY